MPDILTCSLLSELNEKCHLCAWLGSYSQNEACLSILKLNNLTTKNFVDIVVFLCMSNVDAGVAACNRTMLCCNLGRKAVRLSYPAMYTCNIEALSRGLEHHTSVSHRLKYRLPSNTQDTQAGRMDAANSLHTSLGFRRRLMLCKTKEPSQKRCFEECCRRKLRKNKAKVKNVANKQVSPDRSNLNNTFSAEWTTGKRKSLDSGPSELSKTLAWFGQVRKFCVKFVLCSITWDSEVDSRSETFLATGLGFSYSS